MISAQTASPASLNVLASLYGRRRRFQQALGVRVIRPTDLGLVLEFTSGHQVSILDPAPGPFCLVLAQGRGRPVPREHLLETLEELLLDVA